MQGVSPAYYYHYLHLYINFRFSLLPFIILETQKYKLVPIPCVFP